MIYRGYKITHNVRVYEEWDFKLDDDRMLYLTTIIHHEPAGMAEDSGHFSIYTPRGKRLYNYPDTFRKATAFIDKRIKRIDSRFRSGCHNALVQRSSNEKDRFYICTTCHQPCTIEKTNDS